MTTSTTNASARPATSACPNGSPDERADQAARRRRAEAAAGCTERADDEQPERGVRIERPPAPANEHDQRDRRVERNPAASTDAPGNIPAARAMTVPQAIAK